MALVKEHLQQTKQWKQEYGDKTLVLTQVGSFFESYGLKTADGAIHGSNIVEFATLNDMVIANKNCTVGDDAVVMAGVGVPYIEPYLKKMQEHDYTIVLYKQDSQSKGTGRSLAEIISPGTFFGENSTALSNSIMCVWLHYNAASSFSPFVMLTVGTANIDIFTGKTSLSQFHVPYTHDVGTYDQLERQLLLNQPSECILISNLPEPIMQDIVQFVGLGETKIHVVIPDTKTTKIAHQALKATKQIYQEEILRKFYPNAASFVPDGDSFLATQAFCFLLDFVYQHNPNLVNTVLPPLTERNRDKLLLANHSLVQLNITEDARYKGKHRSVSALLNHCLTAMGQRQFLYALQNPVSTLSDLEHSYDLTAYVLKEENTALWENWRECLQPMQDMDKFHRKVFLQKVTPRDLAYVYSDLKSTLMLYDSLEAHPKLFLHEKRQIKQECQAIISSLDQVFSNLEDMKQYKEINSDTRSFFKKGFNTELDSVVQASLDSGDQLEAIRAYLSSLCGDASSKESGNAIKIHHTAKSPPLLLGTSRRVMLMEQNKPKGLHYNLPYLSQYTQQQEHIILDLNSLETQGHGSAKKDKHVFSRQITGICSSIQTARDQLVQSLQKLFHDYIQITFFKHLDQLSQISKFITALDVLQCKVYIARKYNFCRPTLATEEKQGRLAFTELRHPLIEQLQLKELYVTNDLNINNGLLLYGTNAVGKTSFIKSVGIAVVMAQAGLFVPCATFCFQPFTALFTRILGNDNLFKGQSTFAVEMSELRTILTQADDKSLVLGDELCSGTESNSALSIFMTGLEELHKRNSVFMFATHFHEIAQYEELQSLKGMLLKHMAVRFDQEKQVLVYDRKLRDGPGQGMYGLEVCKALHLPYAFLQRAHELRRKYDQRTESILSLNVSRYNAQKLKSLCQLCQQVPAKEIHHLQHQKEAREDNAYIHGFHKNHPANLAALCEACHTRMHTSHRGGSGSGSGSGSGGKQHKMVHSLDGEMLLREN